MTLTGLLVVAALFAGVIVQGVIQVAMYRLMHRHYEMVRDYIRLTTAHARPGDRP